jgi:hypothetical protein
MLVICVALLKGGVSQTTTALAEVATLSVPTVAIHTDPPVIKDSGPLACTDVKPEMGRP